MKNHYFKSNEKHLHASQSGQGNSRRNFLKIGGMAAVGSSLFLYSCSSDDDGMEEPPVSDVFDLGSGDVGILNYAYALEQLEAAFYTMVLDGSYWANASAEEKKLLEDLYSHEVIHREFFETALNSVADSSKVLPELEFNFDSVDFSSRTSVLSTAQTLEDTGVAAYNGAGNLIQETNYLVVAGKIVSVEARHAAAIRSILQEDFTAFAGPEVVDENGLGLAKPPSEILQAVGNTGFIETQFTANNLPTG